MTINLSNFFLESNKRVINSFRSHGFDSFQVLLLEEGFNHYQKKVESSVFGSSVFIFYIILKTWEKEFDEQAELLVAFFTLYILSADLFDDIQDDDLRGKTYEQVGVPIAINNAITLLFLSLDFLVKAIEIESNAEKKLRYLKVFNDASLLAVKGQHKDLMGSSATKTTEEVLEMQKEKASSFSLIAQCAAIFSDCNEEQIKTYQNISEQMVLIFQIVDDIKDIYGKKISPDLITNKITYPIACFLQYGSESEILKFNELKKQLPDSIKEIRELLYSSVAIKKSCKTIEKFRVNIHKNLYSMNAVSPSVRTILYIIDSLASSIYKIPLIKETQLIFHPNGKWYEHVENMVNMFFENMKVFNAPKRPLMFPWHLPQWMYEPNRDIIFYSDIEGNEEEIIPIQSKLTGIHNLEKLKEVNKTLSCGVMAHELFHYWRKKSGKLTKDYWYEEWVANKLAISYVREFYPDIFDKTKFILDELLLNSDFLNNKCKEILARFINSDYKPNSKILGYEVDFNEMNLIQLHMINKLYNQKMDLGENVKNFL